MRLTLNKDNYNLISITDLKREYPALKSDSKSLGRLKLLLNLYRKLYGKRKVEVGGHKFKLSLDPYLAVKFDFDAFQKLTKSDIEKLELRSKL